MGPTNNAVRQLRVLSPSHRVVDQWPSSRTGAPSSARPETSSAAWSGLRLGHLPAVDRHLFRLFGQGPRQALSETLVHRAVEQWARVTPTAVAIQHQGEQITYGEFDRQADRLADRLRALGVRSGDHVALFAVRSIPFVVGLLATLKTGAAYVPQDVRVSPPSQLRHVMRTASTKVVLTLERFRTALPGSAGQRVIPVDRVMTEPFDPPAEPPSGVTAKHRVDRADDSDQGCYVLFTSGTTGRPNGVKVTHRNVCNLLLTEPGGLGIQPGWRVGQILNIGFDMAAWEILGSLMHGATLVIRGSDIAETVETVDVVIATPSVLSLVDPRRCRRVKVVAVAGEPCPRALADRWAERCTFYNGCGPTEVTIVNTMQRHHPGASLLSIGRPTPNNTVYVLDDRGKACAIGEVGEMWAGGDCVSAGYLDNPSLNAERYAPDPFLGGSRMMFRTRDLGRWTPDSELETLGRTDDR